MNRVPATPVLRGVRRTASTASVRQSRQRAADQSLSEKFNLASLNGGKNPFQTASDRLLAFNKTSIKVPEAPRKLKREGEMRDVYSLDYLMGKKPATKKQPRKNPFDVGSAKLM